MPTANLPTVLAARWQVTRTCRIARRELAAMSACELDDMGITQLDVSRLFEPRLAPEFHSRGIAGRVAHTSIFKLFPQGPAVLTSLESLA